MVGPKSSFLTALVDLNLVVRYRIIIRMCELEILPDFNLAAAKTNCHFLKFPAGPKNTTIVYV